MNGDVRSYTTAPLSEFLGSHIYELLDIPVHETLLGIYQEKVVVACCDFLNYGEVLIDYNAIKNNFDGTLEKKLESFSSSKENYVEIEEVRLLLKENEYFKNIPEIKNRFWDMFVIDAFINNNDRNPGNWGLIYDEKTDTLRMSLVYDNGASFNNKLTDEKINKILSNEVSMQNSFYNSRICAFMNNDNLINPLKLIESKSIPELNEAIIRIVPKIDMPKIKDFINDVPNNYQDYAIISDLQKEFYLKSSEYGYKNILLPTYEILAK